MTKGKYTKGFTLVELLVVIAIIGVLAGALFLVINPAKLLAKTRDAKRISELTSVNKAIASALADGKITLAPNAVNTVDTATGVTGANGWVRFGLPAGSVGLADYMPVLPRDPQLGATVGGVAFYYRFQSDITGWKLGAKMESIDSATVATNDGGTQNTCTTVPATACAFEVGTNMTLVLN